MTSPAPTPSPGAEQPAVDMLQLSTQELAQGTVLVKATGEIDLLTIETLQTTLREQLSGAARLVVLDLDGVSFLASCGLAALVEASTIAKERAVTLRLVSTARSVTRPLTATGLLSSFELFEDVATATAGAQ